MKKQLCLTASLALVTFASAANAIEVPEGFHGNLAAGLQISTGNNEIETLNVDGEAGFNHYKWQHSLTFRAVNASQNDVRSDEQYRLGLRSRRDLTEQDYLFGEIDYVDDRFTGFDYRVSEVLGYGRTWMQQDDFLWSSNVGAGFQQTRTNAGDSENAPLGRIQNNITWQINERVEFNNKLRADFSDVNVYLTDTSLRTELSEALFLKVAFITETLSDVPAGREKTDTDTLINIGYEF